VIQILYLIPIMGIAVIGAMVLILEVLGRTLNGDMD